MEPTSLRLPAPLASRPLVIGDAAAVADLIARCEQHDLGEVVVEYADIVSDWQRPSFDLATESIGVFHGDAIVAAAEVYRGRRAEVHVAPEARGAGIGGALAEWTWGVARRRGSPLVGQPIADSQHDAAALLTGLGYRAMWTSWVLALPAGAAIPHVELPAGFRVRDAVPGQDERAAWRVVEDAFNEWPDREPTSYDDWEPTVMGRIGFEPWMLQLAVEDVADGEEIVGACVVFVAADTAYVAQLAVRADRRGRGLAQALLVRAFALGAEHGATSFDLSTDSRTGALGLYLRVGMQVTQTWTHLARDV